MATRKKTAKMVDASLESASAHKARIAKIPKGAIGFADFFGGPEFVKPTKAKKDVPKKVVEYRALRAKNNPRVAAIYRRVLGV